MFTLTQRTRTNTNKLICKRNKNVIFSPIMLKLSIPMGSLPYHGVYHSDLIERFSYDLEMKTREQNRTYNKRTEIEQFDWCIERIQTHLGFGWLSERSGKQTSCPKNFLEIALTSYCNTIGQSNNAFSILGFQTLTETIFQGHTKIALMYVGWSFIPYRATHTEHAE